MIPNFIIWLSLISVWSFAFNQWTWCNLIIITACNSHLCNLPHHHLSVWTTWSLPAHLVSTIWVAHSSHHDFHVSRVLTPWLCSPRSPLVSFHTDAQSSLSFAFCLYLAYRLHKVSKTSRTAWLVHNIQMDIIYLPNDALCNGVQTFSTNSLTIKKKLRNNTKF